MGRCIVYTGIRLLLLICPFISSFVFLSCFQTLKVFVTFFSGTVRPRRLELGTHVDNGLMYRVYRNQVVTAYSSLYVFIVFIFLSTQFSNIKIFVTLFSGTVRPRRLKLGTHVDNGQMFVYSGIRLLLLRHFISFFFLSNFQILKFFVTFFSGTMRPRRLKLHTLVDSGQMYRVYRNQAVAAYSSL